MPKKVLIALPPRMLAKVDHIAHDENRTRSDLIREGLRRYISDYEDKAGSIPTAFDHSDEILNNGGSNDNSAA